MGRVVWQDWMDRVVLERYADEKNDALAKELGVGVRTLCRHAVRLGLRKSDAFMKKMAKEASVEAGRWYEYRRITGQKVKKRRVGGRPFQKGHRWDEATEAKRVKAIRERVWDERVRMIRGMMRTTRWPMVNDFEKSK